MQSILVQILLIAVDFSRNFPRKSGGKHRQRLQTETLFHPETQKKQFWIKELRPALLERWWGLRRTVRARIRPRGKACCLPSCGARGAAPERMNPAAILSPAAANPQVRSIHDCRPFPQS